MARYKDYNYEQGKMIPISFREQILPGTFEHTLSYLIDNELDLSIFDQRYANDDNGRPAYDPAILLKIVLYAYARGIVSSRQIERCCRENVIFMALSADTQPHFTTIAAFISQMEGEIVALFRNVLLICDAQGLIGRDMFAIDGCKLPSNASKEWSGTKAELNAKRLKLERAVRRMVKTHRERDARDVTAELEQREQQYIATLKQQVKKLKAWLDDNDDKPGKTGKPRKSNVTDNESAKMKTSHGVIQGYDGVAAVDDKHQVIVAAEAFGEAQEHELLQPMLEDTQANFAALGDNNIYKNTKITATAAFTPNVMPNIFPRIISTATSPTTACGNATRDFKTWTNTKRAPAKSGANGSAFARPSATENFATTRTNTPAPVRRGSRCTATAPTLPSTAMRR